MSIWAILLLIPGPTGHAPALVDAASVPPPIVSIAKRSADGLPPEHESNLPGCEDEREGEEEDGGDTSSPRTHAHSVQVVRDVPVCAAIAVANLRVSGLDLGTRVAILRC